MQQKFCVLSLSCAALSSRSLRTAIAPSADVAFLALGRVNPATHAVGNTIKRVVIIVASVIAFKTPISTLGVIGSTIAIIGTLLYSLAKSKFG